jgi:hypothetical protein
LRQALTYVVRLLAIKKKLEQQRQHINELERHMYAPSYPSASAVDLKLSDANELREWKAN